MAKLKTASNKKKATNSSSKHAVKKLTKKSGMSLYSNLAYKRRVKEDQRARRKGDLRLPARHPVRRGHRIRRGRGGRTGTAPPAAPPRLHPAAGVLHDAVLSALHSVPRHARDHPQGAQLVEMDVLRGRRTFRPGVWYHIHRVPARPAPEDRHELSALRNG